MNPLERLASALPKAELHLHLEGTLEPEMTFHLARKHGAKLRFPNATALRQAYQFKNLQSFLDLYYEGAGVLRDQEDFHVLTAAYLERAVKDGVWHVEPFFDPQTHTARGIQIKEVVEGIVGALKEGEKKHGITWRLIPCFLRHLDEADARKTFDGLLPFREHFTAVGLDSSEQGNPPSKFERVFARVREAGLHVVAHAGEEGPAAYIRDALEKLKAVRIDHGVRCVEDPEMVKELARKQIPLTTCPLSNVRLGVYAGLKEHPLKKLLDAGVSVTANSDDPPYFGGYLLENWTACLRELNLEAKHLIQLAKNSFSGSFLPEKEKGKWIEKINRVGSSVG
ncbi:MAG: adenosine deaminase [Verrucomicrobia bacterium]|nr:adenosine deaminase [Verrucomicrobiota bacterium]